MNSPESIILMMSQKLKNLGGHEVRLQYSPPTDSRAEAIEASYKAGNGWTKLDGETEQKILGLMKCENIHDEVKKIQAHISRLMESQKNMAGGL